MGETRRKASSTETILPFEQHILDLESQLKDSRSATERQGLERQLQQEQSSVYSNLTPWQHVQLARHNLRPRMGDYTSRIFDDVFELHGDRAIGDDPAMIAGFARFQGQTVVIVGQQKGGVSTEEKVERNFGMAHPEGYRKAMRAYQLAERYGYPVISFVDTPAAHPGIEAEQHGQGPAIAQSILLGLKLRTPILSVVLGEGGSGGALAIGVGDRVSMFEHAIYVICPPERCAEILWRNVEEKELAASALHLTANDLFKLKIIDRVLPEPGGGAHRNPDGAAQVLSEEIELFLADCKRGRFSTEKRQRKFQRMGQWYENVAVHAASQTAD